MKHRKKTKAEMVRSLTALLRRWEDRAVADLCALDFTSPAGTSGLPFGYWQVERDFRRAWEVADAAGLLHKIPRVCWFVAWDGIATTLDFLRTAPPDRTEYLWGQGLGEEMDSKVRIAAEGWGPRA